jgi:hypothetical protein
MPFNLNLSQDMEKKVNSVGSGSNGISNDSFTKQLTTFSQEPEPVEFEPLTKDNIKVVESSDKSNSTVKKSFNLIGITDPRSEAHDKFVEESKEFSKDLIEEMKPKKKKVVLDSEIETDDSKKSNAQLIKEGNLDEIARRQRLKESGEVSEEKEEKCEEKKDDKPKIKVELGKEKDYYDSIKRDEDNGNKDFQNVKDAASKAAKTTKNIASNWASDFKDIKDSTLEVKDDILHVSKKVCKAAKVKAKPVASAFEKRMQETISKRQDKLIEERFKDAKVGKNSYYRLRILPDQAMIESYIGPKSIVKMPSTVKGIKITAVSPDFLHFHAISGIKSAMNSEMIMDTDLSTIRECIGGIRWIQLPKYLEYIPSYLFSDCKKLKEIHVPAAIKTVSIHGFDKCSLEHIYFYGKCPTGLKFAKLGNCKVHVIKEHASSFKGLENLVIEDSFSSD